MDLDRSRGHRLGGGTAALGGHDGRAGDLPVDPPQRAARLLAEPAQTRGGVQHPGDLARGPLVHQDVADGEAAEFVGLVRAGSGDEVGDDAVEQLVLAVLGGDLRVAHAGAGAAHQDVADVVG